MGAPYFLAADYLAGLKALFPRGRIWPKDPDAVQSTVLSGLSPTLERLNSRANYLLIDAFPETTDELLPEWEESLGLPDPCAGVSPTVQQRRAQVVARLTDSGGQSAPYFVNFAATLGYTVTITNYTTARIGRSRCGDPLNGAAWAHAWAVNAPLNTVTKAEIGVASAGEPLASWGNTVLECEIKPRAPAHSVLLFQYN